MSGASAPIARGQLTGQLQAHLIDKLYTTGILVNVGLAPTAGGWVGGQPGGGDFTGYTVIKTGTAVPLEPDPVGRSRMSWKCNYTLTSHGASEMHADDVADQVRCALMDFPEEITLRDVRWGLQKMEIPQLGATVMSTAVDPPFWSVTDAVSVWLSRARGQS